MPVKDDEDVARVTAGARSANILATFSDPNPPKGAHQSLGQRKCMGQDVVPAVFLLIFSFHGSVRTSPKRNKERESNGWSVSREYEKIKRRK
jgi:hypothetical protein